MSIADGSIKMAASNANAQPVERKTRHEVNVRREVQPKSVPTLWTVLDKFGENSPVSLTRNSVGPTGVAELKWRVFKTWGREMNT